ncbi:MAG: FAD-dependent oxidoreductase [Gemmatimonadota bacterium]|nr:FAD-dependent oxidoreductase [Gemmatimonadota bacterium]
MPEPHVVVLGAGPAGVGAAYQLRRTDAPGAVAPRARVTVIEQNPVVGGNAGSFEAGGQRLDYGSHRLHPACDAEILGDIRRLLGGDLLDRPRHGRIHLRGKLIHFPLKPVDLLLRLDKGFAVGTLRDMVRKAIAKPSEGDTFASVLWANLGPTICRDFYFPYARKIWGRDPEELSGIQARRRVSAGSFGKLVKKVLTAVPGLRPPGAGRFFYPRRGFGQISEAYADAATREGAQLMLGWRVTRLQLCDPPDGKWQVTAERRAPGDGRDGNDSPIETRTLAADYVWSTIPISVLARVVYPPSPPEVREAAGEITYRGMILVYLELDADRFTEYDAHYFPAADIAITRLSEPKNYAALEEPRGRTTLCAELPCAVGDEHWRMSDDELGRLVADDLAAAGLPLMRRPVAVRTRRLGQAYPIYLTGYERPFGVLDRWAESLPRLLTYGRQGLFAHDNTHHALYMAYRAADCLTTTGFDDDKWAEYRQVFATHVVED